MASEPLKKRRLKVSLLRVFFFLCLSVLTADVWAEERQAMTQKTVRILSLDGGGIRGYFSSTFLKKFCEDAGLDPHKLHEHFDIITGTSIGGIEALGYANGMSPDELLRFFKERGLKIFPPNSDPTFKFRVIMGLSTDKTFYQQGPLKEALVSVLGNEKRLVDLPGRVVITTWNANTDSPILLSNITGFEPYLRGSQLNAVDVGLSTSAAPLYFPPLVLDDETTHVDGGVFQNNPVLAAYLISKKLFPSASRFCVLSVGTGLKKSPFKPQKQGFHPSLGETLKEDLKEEFHVLKERLIEKHPQHEHHLHLLSDLVGGIAPYNVEYLFYLMENVFIPGPQEFNAQAMAFEQEDLFDDIFYYRFQYFFKEDEDGSMDNADSKNLEKLASYAEQQYEVDKLKIQNFIAHFKL